jgi:hypothetical protein
MKQITTGLCIAFLMLFTANSIAQKSSSNKPFLFTDYPAVIDCTEAQLNSLFIASNDMNVSLSLPGNLTLQGEVTNRATKYNSLQTVSIKLPAFRNILFSVTKRDDEGKKPVFTAYLLNTDYADGYQLKRNAGNTYQFIKIETAKLLPTCNQ